MGNTHNEVSESELIEQSEKKKSAGKRFLSEFGEFINQGNVVDLAIAVAVGAAFTAIVDSIVSDLIMPLVSSLLGGFDFSSLVLVIPLGAGESAITYGNFINAVVQFIIIALVIFFIVRGLNNMKSRARTAKEEIAAPSCPLCMEEIKEGATRCPHCTAELTEPAA